MSDLRFYDWDLNLIGISKPISSNWTIYGNDVGTFQAVIDYEDENFARIMNERYVIAVQGKDHAIITGKDVKSGTFFGRTPNFILTKRTHPAFSSESNTNLIAESVVNKCFSDEIAAGVFEIVSSNTVLFTNTEKFEITSRSECLRTVADILEREAACHRVCFDLDRKKWCFEVYKGTERYITLSEDNLNAYDTNYTEDALSYCNGGWYTKKADDTDGADEELYISVAESGETLLKRWECSLSSGTESEAKTALNEKKWIKKITLSTRDLKHRIDYNIGDKFVVKVKKGGWKTGGVLTVSGVNKWYEDNDAGEEPIFKEE